MANDNQNNQDPKSSLRDQVTGSLNGRNDGDQPDSSEKNDRSPQPSSDESQETASRTTQTRAGSRAARRRGKDKTTQTVEEPTPIETDEKPTNTKKQTRKKEDRLVGRIVLIVVSVLVLMMAIFGFTFYKYVDAGLQPLDKNNKKLVQVHIPEGSSNKQIAAVLEESNVIKSGMVFNYYVKFKNLTDFQAGYYQMSPSMTLDEIGEMLKEGGTPEPTKIADGKVTIPEGYDLDKIGEAIEKNTDFKKADFIALMKNEDFFNQMKAKYPDLLESAATAEGVRYRLEGYLFPATYDYYKKATLPEFVEQMIAKMNTVMEQYTPTIHAKNLTNQQVLTLASLVEKEGVKEADRKQIAQVFFNRLAADMPIQSDISILYALGEHKETVTYADLEVDSSYNLYKNTGYGPGPLDSPSEESIKAVLNPTPSDYLYFVADISTGKVYFSKTYEEHQVLVNQYVNNSSSE